MWQSIDRRKFPRADYPCKVVVFKDSRRMKFDTHTENIGIGGICVILDKKLSRFTQVELALYLKNGQAPVESRGRIVWAIARGELEFDTGIEFIDLKEVYQLRITNIVEAHLKESQG